MRNIFLFIRRFFTLIVFIVLQVFALWMLFKFNRLHEATFLSVANEVTGRINTQVDKLDDYFHQGEENRRLHKVNDSLMNLLKSNYSFPDTSEQLVTDTLRIDTSFAVRRYLWRDAKVVYNTVTSDKNYIQLNRGSNYGIRENMAVFNSDGALVGRVVHVSPNFSSVMSLLHVQSAVSSALKKTGDFGTLEWNGENQRLVQLRGISKSVEVKVGDTVVTSQYSNIFPPGKIIGTIAEVKSDPATGFYILNVRTAVNFRNIQQVFVVENLQRDEQVQLQLETERKVEQQKRIPN